MNHIKYLEFQRVMKELQFVESDLEYQSEVLKLSDSEFLKSVNIFLSNYPELEEIYKQKDKEFAESVNESIQIQPEVSEYVSIEMTQAKKLYRTIVKSTHPDKVINNKLNDLYKLATRAYDEGDLISLYRVSSELNINFEFDDDLIDQIRDKIDLIKSQSNMLKSTYTFRWVKSEQEDKNKIIFDFIKSKIA